MKTIIYSIIAIFIFSIIATSFTNQENKNKNILIQTTDINASSVLLTQSANIISNRLKDFSSEKFELIVMSEKNQIQIILSGIWDLEATENLLIQKGSLAFYETYNAESLAKLLNGDNHLFSLLNSSANNSDVKIGCTSHTEIGKVNDYLETLDLNQQCKFAWNQHYINSDVCLYALKLNNEKGALLKGTDVESMNYNQDKVSKTPYIEIRFNKSAFELWSDATKRNINNAIAIVLDDAVISAPIVQSVINNGNCQITGDFTRDQTKYIAAIGNNGELPINFILVK